MFPLPRSEFPLIVLMLVPDTNVSCLVDGSIAAHAERSVSYAWTFVPISKPKFVRAAEALATSDRLFDAAK